MIEIETPRYKDLLKRLMKLSKKDLAEQIIELNDTLETLTNKVE